MAEPENTNIPPANTQSSTPIPPEVKPAKNVAPFNADQMEIIQAMIQEARGENNRRPDAISMYNLRDPKAIESVRVKRMYGKFVMGFKNLQTDPLKKTPKYLVYKADATRGLFKEPFVTLLLQQDEKSPVEEKEVLLLDYMTEREFLQVPVVKIDLDKKIKSYGYLGSNGEYAGEVDEHDKPVARMKVLAEVQTEERVFFLELPGFSQPVSFISDFLA